MSVFCCNSELSPKYLCSQMKCKQQGVYECLSISLCLVVAPLLQSLSQCFEKATEECHSLIVLTEDYQKEKDKRIG
jgi:hypothetical protein